MRDGYNIIGNMPKLLYYKGYTMDYAKNPIGRIPLLKVRS